MKILVLTLSLFCMISLQAQELTLPHIFSDHMVLQRDEPIKIWGWDEAGQNVSITLNQVTETTTANNDGYWQLYLPSQPAGGSYEIIISGSSTIILSDVLIGDVWIAGGQSNMEWKLSWGIDGSEEEIATSHDFPVIRFFEVQNAVSYIKKEQISSGAWNIASPEQTQNFSGVAWYFAKLNHIEEGVPVGIIESNWGGTPAESWAPMEDLLNVNGYKDRAAYYLDPNNDIAAEIAENDKAWGMRFDLLENPIRGIEKDVHTQNYDDSNWSETNIPNSTSLSDVTWLRKTFEVNVETIDSATIFTGDIYEQAHVYVNGEFLNFKTWESSTATYSIPPEILQVGSNLLVMRTTANWNNEIMLSQTEPAFVSINDQKIDLTGSWKYSNDIEPKLPPTKRYEHEPGFLYNSMIHPIAGYRVKGVIWYQGESNVGDYSLYNDLFSTMITSWRTAWNQGDFPFLYVQLANFLERSEYPQDSYWAGLREAQTQTLALPNTGMATIIDIGEADDIHPRNKKDVGYRLWQAAKKIAYHQDVVHSGPMYNSHEVVNNKIEITFDYANNGWEIKNFDRIEGFAVAGEDSIFHWADAEIDKNKIRVWSNEVPNPIAVRYAWSDNPKTSLYNREGLPVVPFRTDDWKY